MVDLVLLHSRVLGPSSWSPLTARLESFGHRCLVPEPDRQPGSTPTPWHELPSALASLVDGTDQPVIVGHSGAGPLAAPVAATLDAAGVIFLAARLPPPPGPVPPAERDFVQFLEGLADEDGLLPPWSRWWGDDVLAALIDDPAVRAVVSNEQPRLPLAWFDDHFTVPNDWGNRRLAYLQFSEAYDAEMDAARAAGSDVADLHGGHLHHINAPGEVAHHIVRVLDSWRLSPL
jgi:hypothetical protein